MEAVRILGFLIFVFLGIAVHEFAHAWAADRLGDPTARFQGRLSLNPLVHLDPLGTLMILTSMFYGFGIGWGKPVPVNPYNLRMNPRAGMALVAFSGPFSNLLLALGLGALAHLPLPYLAKFALVIGVFANIGLALFNMLPLPPLDGFDVLMGILDAIRNPTARQIYYQLSRLEAQGPLVLLAVLMLDYILPINLLGSLLGPPFRFLTSLILW